MRQRLISLTATAITAVAGTLGVTTLLSSNRNTVTATFYTGSHGTNGFEGVVTCHGFTSTAHGTLHTYHGCGRIHH